MRRRCYFLMGRLHHPFMGQVKAISLSCPRVCANSSQIGGGLLSSRKQKRRDPFSCVTKSGSVQQGSLGPIPLFFARPGNTPRDSHKSVIVAI